VTDIFGFAASVKHLNLVDLAEGMSALHHSIAEEEEEHNKERLLSICLDKMKVRLHLILI